MSKINFLPALREDKLEAIVDFAFSVENFCATVDACGLEEYFYNMTFLHQLVNKLPPSIKLNWAQYRLSLPTVNIPSFSSWIYSLAEAASAVTIPNTTLESKTLLNDSRTAKNSNFFRYSNAKTAADSCLVCKASCKSNTKCKRFLEFSRDSRWATVQDLGLCRRCQVLFRYLPVVLHGKHRSIETFAFLDDGSELTLLDKELADELQLEGDAAPLCLLWTGGAKRREDDSKNVKLEICSKHDSKMYTMQGVRTVAELLLPTQSLNVEELSELYQHLKGLPITSYQDVRPRILIGMKDQHLSLVKKSREGALHEPIAVKTRLGWTICGGGSQNNATNLVHSVFHICACSPSSYEDLHKMMKEYFAVDSLGVVQPKKRLVSAEEERAQNLLEGRTGYARKVTDEERSKNFPRTWYLPIFPVTNANKPGKIRMVWDAAAVAHGISLNSALLKGPDQPSELFTILVQFREGRVALTGDVREMFLQVFMRPEDQQCQRSLWYDEDGTLFIYALRVMNFMACCSPSSTQFVKNLNAERFKGDYPAAVEVIQKRHYVDDMLVSVATEKEAVELALQVKEVHAAGGFETRNWISNSKRVAEALEEKNTEEKNLDLSPELATEKVLGMWWCTDVDTFTYKVGWDRYGRALLEGQHRPTKRQMLRVLMSVFDPLGLIAQFLMYLKILLQEVWRSGIGWDDQISIPRCYISESSIHYGDIQLHTFVGASENGIATTCYLRFNHQDVVECKIVAAKTRVVPLKFLSIPRLELQAALIGSRLARTLSESLTIHISRRVFWSDSQDTLCWIRSDHRRYSPFVAFWVSENLELPEMAEWRYVPTDLNVADDGTKWKGLPNLKPTISVSHGRSLATHVERLSNYRPRTSSQCNDTFNFSDPILQVNDFSNWGRLVRVVAFVQRFSNNCKLKRLKQTIISCPLSSSEISSAEAYLLRQVQLESYPDEVTFFQQSQHEPTALKTPLPKTSPLHQKSPWLDQNGVLRMRGRITNCDYATEDAKNPIILPRDHPTTKLIIAHFHQKLHHQNHETVINEIRQKYSIPKLRTAFINVRINCQRCKNHRVDPKVPIMAIYQQLDHMPSQPLHPVGVDFFGSYETVVGHRSEKRWVCWPLAFIQPAQLKSPIH
ncbi:uncharacterized protein LOC134206373 [Armigeres subalbatus]|uniref:uncharacterized protein LOC134206373 n=1 Tax=Armigeres subalbatus TaxID=124917 RepID=UPI002ED69AE1